MARKKRPPATEPERLPKTSSSQRDEPEQGPQESESPFPDLTIDSHRALATQQREIFRRFNQRPDLSRLLLLNPALAFREVGVQLTPALRHHVLHAVEHPPATLRRRRELESSLADALEESPRPLEPEWVSALLFDKLKLEPLAIKGLTPAYREPLNAPFIARLTKLRPPATKNRYPPRRQQGGMRLQPPPWTPLLQRLDLDAPLPEIKKARRKPAAVSLQELYFYKDSHPLARDVLELGIILARGFPIQSPESYRRIKEGTKRNALHSWIKSVHFPAGDDDEPDL
jgi:hypothetical protein